MFEHARCRKESMTCPPDVESQMGGKRPSWHRLTDKIKIGIDAPGIDSPSFGLGELAVA